MTYHKYLIVGGGMTADAAVKGIRQVDENGEIGILCGEPDPPYKRPPLSKGLWTGDIEFDEIWCGTGKKGAELMTATRAASLDVSKKQVIDHRGNIYRYEKLLLATGGEPTHLPFAGDNVIYYRTCADYRRLRQLAEGNGHFAVLGGGFIGTEIAAALHGNGNKVTMVFPEAKVGALMLPMGLAGALTDYYTDKGVTVVSGCKPSEVDVAHGATTLHLENGHVFSIEGVVAGIGIDPDVGLAEEAGMEVDDGIVVDDQLRTKHPDVFAAGDVARFYSPQLEKRLRVEHEDNALTMGETAGRNMAGEKEAYMHLPYFYSNVFDLGFEAVGETDPALEVITDLKDLQENGCIFYMDGDRVRGVVFWNMSGKTDAGRELISAPGPHDAESLRAWEHERLADRAATTRSDN